MTTQKSSHQHNYSHHQYHRSNTSGMSGTGTSENTSSGSTTNPNGVSSSSGSSSGGGRNSSSHYKHSKSQNKNYRNHHRHHHHQAGVTSTSPSLGAMGSNPYVGISKKQAKTKNAQFIPQDVHNKKENQNVPSMEEYEGETKISEDSDQHYCFFSDEYSLYRKLGPDANSVIAVKEQQQQQHQSMKTSPKRGSRHYLQKRYQVVNDAQSQQQQQQQKATCSISNTGSTSGASSGISSFQTLLKLTKDEKERLKLNNHHIISVAFVSLDESRQSLGDLSEEDLYQKEIDLINQILQKQYFKKLNLRNQNDYQSNTPVNNDSVLGENPYPIDSFHDSEKKHIYLYLTSMALQQKARNYKELEEKEYKLMRALLFIFQTCHVIIFITRGYRYDLKYLKIFRILQLAKQYFNETYLNHLEASLFTNSHKYSSLYFPGKVLPAICHLFYFNSQNHEQFQRLASNSSETREGNSPYHSGSNNASKLLEKMQQNMESQVRSILRKGKFSGTDNTRTPLLMLDPTKCSFVLSEVSTKQISMVQDFLKKQYDYFLRQMGSGRRYTLPSSIQWYHASYALEELLMNPSLQLSSTMIEKIIPLLNPDSFFSENRCTLAYQHVKDQFTQVKKKKEAHHTDEKDSTSKNSQQQENHQPNVAPLESYKTLDDALQAALFTFEAYACGPLQESFKQKLSKEITEVYHQYQKLQGESATHSDEQTTEKILPIASSDNQSNYNNVPHFKIPFIEMKTYQAPSSFCSTNSTLTSSSSSSSTGSNANTPLRLIGTDGKPISLISDFWIERIGNYQAYSPEKGLPDHEDVYAPGANILPYFLIPSNPSTSHNSLKEPIIVDCTIPLDDNTISITESLNDMMSLNAPKVKKEVISGVDQHQKRNRDQDAVLVNEDEMITYHQYNQRSSLNASSPKKKSPIQEKTSSKTKKRKDSQRNKSNNNIQAKTSSSADSNNECRISIGFEYESSFHKKFILTSSMLPKHHYKLQAIRQQYLYQRTKQSSDDSIHGASKQRLDALQLLQLDVPFFLHWPTHIFGAAQNFKKSEKQKEGGTHEEIKSNLEAEDKNALTAGATQTSSSTFIVEEISPTKRTPEIAKLQKIYVNIPANCHLPFEFEPKLVLEIEDSTSDSNQRQSFIYQGIPIMLPCDSFLAIHFQFTSEYDQLTAEELSKLRLHLHCPNSFTNYLPKPQ